MAEQRPRNKNGQFEKGQPSPEGARRKKGSLNKFTRDIKEGCIAGFARHGSNGRGEGGFAGFCFFLAKKHPKAAARIVEKLLPLTVNGNLPLGAHIGSVNIVSVPSNKYLSHEDIERMRDGPLLIDHEPAQPVDVEVATNEPGEVDVLEVEPQLDDDGPVSVRRRRHFRPALIR